MDWAAWGPTITTIVCWIFFAGMVWNRINNHTDQIKEHDKKFEGVDRRFETGEKEVKEHGILITRLDSFQQGWQSARAIYDRTNRFERSGDHSGGD